ncbi:MAG: glycosyltransferase [Hyphomonadaceae bacterium]|nr:glycosyltransferase [Hyphomonadaceae bacterium]
MTSPTPAATPLLSVVIAVFNEAENVASVARETLAALESSKAAREAGFEIVFVDDGSDDATVANLKALADPRIVIVRHVGRCGKSQAVRTGVLHARGRWIGTMDGDGQNDPIDIVKMLDLALAAGGSPLVAGVRRRRNDPLSRLVATRIANGIRQAILNDGCPDTGCGLKLFEREKFLLLPVFEGQHRFLPALFKTYGHPLILHDVNHRARSAGVSKYSNIGRALVGIVDMAGVVWLRARTRAPRAVERA